MMKTKYFEGNQISEYGQEHGYVDYGCLSKSFDHVRNDSIVSVPYGYFEPVNGDPSEIEDTLQVFIIDNWGYEILSKYTDEIVMYNDKLDIYIWCVTHFGTNWDYVCTNIPIED